jgi:hypothetical protein
MPVGCAPCGPVTASRDVPGGPSRGPGKPLGQIGSIVSRKNLLDKMLDRAEDVDRDLRKATRRAFKSRKRNKNKDRSARKLARRNSEDIHALTAQVAALSRHVSALTEREPGGHRTQPATGGVPAERTG